MNRHPPGPGWYRGRAGTSSGAGRQGRSGERPIIGLNPLSSESPQAGPESSSQITAHRSGAVLLVGGARFGRDAYFFLGLERAGLVQVWRRKAFGKPELVQALPTGYRPEGILAIPRRGLLVVANEENEGFFRSSLSIYLRKRGTADYPTVQSVNRADGVPIPWGALSALAADSKRADKLYTVHDSFYVNSRIYTLDVGQRPARITRERVLKKDGSPVAYDLEGLARRPCEDGGFWAVSEGSGAAGDAGSTLNLLLKIAEDGTVLEEIPLPDETNAKQRRFGFEGVTVTGRCGNTERVYVAFQREWDGDPGTESGGSDCAADGDCAVRIARYRPKNGNWKFVYYPLDAPTSPAGGWVGLSEVTALDRETFVVIERDNQGGRDARIKQLCTFSIEGLQFRKEGKAPDFDFISKDACVDILPDLKAPAGQVLDKPEGFAVAADGRAFVITDNDGVDDTSGETRFFSPGHLDELF